MGWEPDCPIVALFVANAAEWIVLVMLSSSTIAACTPSPEKVCAHEVELSPLVAERECVELLAAFRAEEPPKFKSYGNCVLESKNIASLSSCHREFHPEAFQPAPKGEAYEGLDDLLKRLADRYKDTKELCPSAKQDDPGWSCLRTRPPGYPNVQPKIGLKEVIAASSSRWQYEFHSEAGKGVALYARGAARAARRSRSPRPRRFEGACSKPPRDTKSATCDGAADGGQARAGEGS